MIKVRPKLTDEVAENVKMVRNNFVALKYQ